MMKGAKKRGYVTQEEIANVLPSDKVDPDTIEDVLGMFSEMGINVVETEEADEEEREREEPAAAEEEEAEGGDLVETSQTRAPARAETTAKEPADRTDDPVRMYLREMGT